jgi:hypothetical protein
MGAFSSVPITISTSPSEKTFQPSARVQNRAAWEGRERQRRCDGVRPARSHCAVTQRDLPFHKDQNLQPERTVVPAQPKPYLLQGADMLVRTE